MLARAQYILISHILCRLARAKCVIILPKKEHISYPLHASTCTMFTLLKGNISNISCTCTMYHYIRPKEEIYVISPACKHVHDVYLPKRNIYLISRAL